MSTDEFVTAGLSKHLPTAAGSTSRLQGNPAYDMDEADEANGEGRADTATDDTGAHVSPASPLSTTRIRRGES
jgi:hypothetical protein